MSKSPDAFRTISEVAEWLGVQAHVLRFWESKFTQVKPVKRAGGRRYYRPADMLLLGGIKKLLHDDGLPIKDVQAMLREHGAAHVAEFSHPLDTGTEEPPAEAPPADKLGSDWQSSLDLAHEEAAQDRAFLQAGGDEAHAGNVVGFPQQAAPQQPASDPQPADSLPEPAAQEPQMDLDLDPPAPAGDAELSHADALEPEHPAPEAAAADVPPAETAESPAAPEEPAAESELAPVSAASEHPEAAAPESASPWTEIPAEPAADSPAESFSQPEPETTAEPAADVLAEAGPLQPPAAAGPEEAPELTAAPEPEQEPLTEPEAATEAGPAAMPAPLEQAADAAAGAEPASEAVADAAPEQTLDAQPFAEPDPAPGFEPAAEAEPAADQEQEAGPDSIAEETFAAEPEAAAEPESAAEPDPAMEPAMEAGIATGPEAGMETAAAEEIAASEETAPAADLTPEPALEAEPDAAAELTPAEDTLVAAAGLRPEEPMDFGSTAADPFASSPAEPPAAEPVEEAESPAPFPPHDLDEAARQVDALEFASGFRNDEGPEPAEEEEATELLVEAEPAAEDALDEPAPVQPGVLAHLAALRSLPPHSLAEISACADELRALAASKP
ncbi:MerR family transcriptional regulator [Leisingera sp. ANG-Vp]|uniref:MerR family transcriptional regulator n=1 Tax=Leisingera sp. ANG-Vp TaxID=1577896 RepID=UPI00068DC802|nr:MerR family transcriptional regulator [Leisingera sp. ANG-Vp]